MAVTAAAGKEREMEDAHGSSSTVQQDGGGGRAPITVSDTADLMDALNPQNAGRTIRLKPGTYKVEKTLVVPNGATLQGAGVMLFDDQGLPVKFEWDITTTTITANPGFKGPLVTLGNQSSVRRLVLEGPSNVQVHEDGLGANVVAVASRRRGDIISATIDQCQLINKINSGVADDGPTGGAILAYTRNPKKGESPPPHEDAEVIVQVTQSILRSPKDGKAVFAMNFASHGKVTIRLKKNNIVGSLDVIGGLSRPDAVVGATTTITSIGNHYLPHPGSGVEAWQIVGGSTSPIGGDANTDSNSASVESQDDQIENFRVGIVAVGGRRLPGGDGTCSHNKARLELLHMTLHTERQGAMAPADFEFTGALSVDGASTPGDANIVHVLIQETTGSGSRANKYANSVGEGSMNMLVIVGSPTAFTDSNHNIVPPPHDGFFEYRSTAG